MRLMFRVLLAGSATALVTAGAQAADLPTRKAAPVEYVRVCNAYGAGFFYIPGTDTCLKVGGLVLAQARIQPVTGGLYGISPAVGSTIGTIPAAASAGLGALAGAIPAATAYRSVFAREVFGHDAAARVELDARTQSPWGTVRTFIRLNAQFGSGANAVTGSLANGLGINAFNNTAGPTISKEITFLDKAFIQFAGFTAGRSQSLFDFYGDSINYESLRGSNQTAWMISYTATLGGGISASLSFEDAASHRSNTASILPAVVPGAVGPAGAIAGPLGATAFTGNERMPNVVGNLRIEQPWGAAQLMGAIQNVRANLFAAPAATSGTGGAPTAYAFPVNSSSSIGYALGGGVQFNLDMLGKGDKFWLQAIYAKGAIGYVSGSNLSFNGGVNATANYGIGSNRLPNSLGWANFSDSDCVFTWTGACEKSSAFAITAALKHFWTPTISSGLFGSYYSVEYSRNATNPVPAPGFAFTTGITNYRETRLGTNLVWTPVKNFDIGGEMTWVRGMTSRPFGLAPDVALQSVGLPVFRSITDVFAGKVRMIRAF